MPIHPQIPTHIGFGWQKIIHGLGQIWKGLHFGPAGPGLGCAVPPPLFPPGGGFGGGPGGGGTGPPETEGRYGGYGAGLYVQRIPGRVVVVEPVVRVSGFKVNVSGGNSILLVR
jgi:hypothetical protein